MKQSGAAAAAGATPERRSFLVRFAAVVCGGLAALFPFAAGWGVLIDPWRRSRSAKNADADRAKLVPICPLAALPGDGTPRAFPVISDVADAWTRTSNQRVGMIYMSRADIDGKPAVLALNAECPHLGCFVDYNAADQHFECPCHKSAFAKDGEKLYGPSRRGLDALPVKLQGNGGEQEILVAFQKFQKGIAERKPAE
jgi:menaquinol-cytochrome c reductase iron-sulfur subunit